MTEINLNAGIRGKVYVQIIAESNKKNGQHKSIAEKVIKTSHNCWITTPENFEESKRHVSRDPGNYGDKRNLAF